MTAQVLVIGLLLGWLVEWVIDFSLWRRATQRAESLRANLAEAEREIHLLRSQTESQMVVSVSALPEIDAEVAALREGLRELEEQRDRWKAEVEEAQRVIAANAARVEAQLAEESRLRTELALVRDEAERHQSNVVNQRATVDALQGQLAEHETLAHRMNGAISDCEREIQRLNAGQSDLVAERDALVTRVSLLSSARDTVARERDALRTGLNRHRVDLAEREEWLREYRARLEAVTEERDRLIAEVQELQHDISLRSQQSETAIRVVNESERMRSDAEATARDLAHQLDQERQETRNLRVELADRGKEILSLESERDLLCCDLDELRSRVEKSELPSDELEALRVALNAAKADLADLDRVRLERDILISNLERLADELAVSRLETQDVRLNLEAAQGEADRLRDVVQRLGHDKLDRDPFERIPGLGPLFQQRLWEAGILRFDQLARVSPDRLRLIVGAEPWQTVLTEAWIEAAESLTREGSRA